MLTAEETLKIDTLIKCPDVLEEECQPEYDLQLMEDSRYGNIFDQFCDLPLMGIPYAVSTMAPPSDPGSSLRNASLSSQTGSPAEGDSGCWLSSDTPLEREPPWYCNYCTLSAFQQSTPVTAHNDLSVYTQGVNDNIWHFSMITAVWSSAVINVFEQHTNCKQVTFRIRICFISQNWSRWTYIKYMSLNKENVNVL